MRQRSLSARRGSVGIAVAALLALATSAGCATAGNDGDATDEGTGPSPVADAGKPTTTRADASTAVRDSGGAVPGPDAGASTPDTGTDPDSGFPDAGPPPVEPDAGNPNPPTGGGVCPSDPTYAILALALIASGVYTDCATGCSATQCCYGAIVCVPL